MSNSADDDEEVIQAAKLRELIAAGVHVVRLILATCTFCFLPTSADQCAGWSTPYAIWLAVLAPVPSRC